MRYNKGYTLVELVIALFTFAVAIGGSYGWVMNIVKVFCSSFDPITGQVVLRVVGIFMPPIGAVMGYL